MIALVSFGKSQFESHNISQNDFQGKALDANRYATKKTVAQGRISWSWMDLIVCFKINQILPALLNEKVGKKLCVIPKNTFRI